MKNDLRIFDSFTKEIKNLKDFIVKDETIRVYVCGITVYDYCHIGHARSLIVFDLLHRFLKFVYPKVIFVRNITDFGLKIKEKAESLGISSQELAQKYINFFHEDLKRLNILSVDEEPRASEYGKEMIEYINILLEKNIAYKTQDGIYFDISKIEGYDSSNFDPDESKDTYSKRNPKDFTLWKFGDYGDQNFESPYGSSGMPGWHIECSAMSKKLLGKTFHIHGGGTDLKFPHHENEIAQCKGAFNCDPAHIWMHNGLLHIDGEKMSKSLRNMRYIRDIPNSFEADSLRYFFLSHNYRSDVEINEEKLQQSRETMKNMRKIFLNKNFEESEDYESITPEDLKELFEDLDSSLLLRNLFTKTSQQVELKVVELKVQFQILKVMGFKFENLCILSGKEIESLILERNSAKLNRNFDKADEIRSMLLDNFVELQDDKDSTNFIFI